MASYDIEHSVPPSSSNTVPSSTSQPPPRRPDFSTFFSHLSNTTTASTQNPHATPMPTDISALYRLLAEGYTSTRQSRSSPSSSSSSDDSLLDEMIALLISEAEHPPTTNHVGVDQDFLDGLERVPRKSLRKGMECPICGQAFVDDPFPLVVSLPCDERGRHVFDLECIAPWLRLHATCPLDRKDLVRREGGVGEMAKKEGGDVKEEEEEDGEWDDMYA